MALVNHGFKDQRFGPDQQKVSNVLTLTVSIGIIYRGYLSSFCYVYFSKLISSICCDILVVHTATSDVQEHLEMGRDLLARGQLAEALFSYHQAVGM